MMKSAKKKKNIYANTQVNALLTPKNATASAIASTGKDYDYGFGFLWLVFFCEMLMVIFQSLQRVLHQ